MIDTLGVITAPTLTASVLTDERDFEALAPEWDELLEHSDQRRFFLRSSWNQLWWRTFRPANSSLFIVTCRDGQGRLAGIAPFYWKQRRTAGLPHLRELQFLGTGIYAQTSEYLDIIARRGFEQTVANTVAGFLDSRPDWDCLSLSEVPADSTILPLFRQALDEDSQIAGCNRAHYINTDIDWDSFKTSLTKSARENIFRRSRRLFQNFECEFRLIDDASELEPAMDALVRLHQARWQTKGEPGAFALSGSEEFLREAARIALPQGRLRLWTLTVNKQVAAVLVGFVDNRIFHAFQSGFDPVHINISLGGVMNGLCVSACVEDKGVDCYDFMGGGDVYKQSWTRTSWDSVRLTCMRPGVRSQAFKTIELAIRVARSVVRKTVPHNLKLAVHKFIIRRRHYSEN